MQFGNAPAQGTIALIVVTALIGALIGVFGKRFAEALTDGIVKPFIWLWEIFYRWIAPRNPLSISLRSYRKHVERSWLTKIENPVGPALDVPLEHAFAPLKLISSSSQETIDLFKHVATQNRCVILGGPGTGKTTLMKSLVTSVINGQADEPLNSLIPVFIVLRKLAVKQQTIKEAIIAAFADFHFPGADKFVDSALSQGKMLIVLDGLDEVGVNREYVSGQIISFCESDDQQIERNHVIVTCREYSYRTEDLRSVIKSIVRVEPFANHHMRVFLQGWPTYKGRSALALYTLIQGDSQIRDICRNPLLLTILTGLYLEATDFEFPTSRSLFYKAAVDELITKRPARREMKQKFDPGDKWHVLQRVSLNRLESVQINEDPEEFTDDAIREQAATVFRKEIDLNDFIKELVEVNGIIKPTSDGIYTCAHRTIQEYFAANEAGRIRTPSQVILRFSNRQDLIEVVYFYCGMLKNIPQLTNVIENFANNDRWLEAGRCLLSMTEIPEAAQIELVTANLSKQISSESEFKPILEVLSSLAQRPEAEFEPARRRFSEAVDRLAKGTATKGASALESALATSPDAAMKVIPGLLKHDAKRWQAAAVQLLKDIGTEESLDQLVQLLTSENVFIRQQAGQALAGLLKSRNKDLKDRAPLLPDRRDNTVWPIEEVFPGRLAIPIAESLAGMPETKNAAIDCAARAVRLPKVPHGREARTFLSNWRNVPRDMRRNLQRVTLGRTLVRIALGVCLVFWFVMLLAVIWCYFKDRTVLVEVNPMRFHVIERGLVRDVEATASEIVSELENNFPPNASGLSRILPWNWSTEPILPENLSESFENLKAYAERGFDLYRLREDAKKHQVLPLFITKEKFDAFEEASRSLTNHLPVLRDNRYFMTESKIADFFVLLLLFPVNFLFAISGMKSWRGTMKSSSPGSTYFDEFYPLLIMGWLLLGYPFSVGTGRIRFVLVLLVVGGLGTGILMRKLDWPRNPLLSVIADVSPSEEDKAVTAT